MELAADSSCEPQRNRDSSLVCGGGWSLPEASGGILGRPGEEARNLPPEAGQESGPKGQPKAVQGHPRVRQGNPFWLIGKKMEPIGAGLRKNR